MPKIQYRKINDQDLSLISSFCFKLFKSTFLRSPLDCSSSMRQKCSNAFFESWPKPTSLSLLTTGWPRIHVVHLFRRATTTSNTTISSCALPTASVTLFPRLVVLYHSLVVDFRGRHLQNGEAYCIFYMSYHQQDSGCPYVVTHIRFKWL